MSPRAPVTFRRDQVTTRGAFLMRRAAEAFLIRRAAEGATNSDSWSWDAINGWPWLDEVIYAFHNASDGTWGTEYLDDLLDWVASMPTPEEEQRAADAAMTTFVFVQQEQREGGLSLDGCRARLRLLFDERSKAIHADVERHAP